MAHLTHQNLAIQRHSIFEMIHLVLCVTFTYKRKYTICFLDEKITFSRDLGQSFTAFAQWPTVQV